MLVLLHVCCWKGADLACGEDESFWVFETRDSLPDGHYMLGAEGVERGEGAKNHLPECTAAKVSQTFGTSAALFYSIVGQVVS